MEPRILWRGGVGRCCLRLELDANKIGRRLPPIRSPMVSMTLLLSVNACQRSSLIPSSNLGLIGVQIRRSETNLYKDNASTSARYLSSVELRSTDI